MSTKYQTLHYCPNKCLCATFETVAHVAQDWEVDALGNFIEATNDCSEVVTGPDNDNIWTCSRCGAEAEIATVRHGGTVEAPMVYIDEDGFVRISPTARVEYEWYVDDHDTGNIRIFYRAKGSDCFDQADVQRDASGKLFFEIYGIHIDL